uniref:Tyr recombinase domain-containing protein n=1 Tax=Strongyloides venezuelensis TaxID=75913 RepID=A0A0K0FRI6_STRVS
MEGETNIQGILHNENNKCNEEKRDTRDENIITHKEVDVGRVDTKKYNVKLSLDKINENLNNMGVSKQAVDWFWRGYRKNLVKCIETILNHWKNFTSQWEYFEFKDVCKFIMYLNEKVKPSSVKTYISYFIVILSLNDVMLSKKEREIIKKIIKGISDDTIIVISEADHSSHIARKLAILILLKHPFRMHELHSIIRENVRIDGNTILITLPTVTKTMNPGTTIKIIDFDEDELRISTHYSLYCAKICPRKVIKKGRSVTPLWIKDDGVKIHLLTLQNWVRKMLTMIGVDENPHSVRSAVISGEKEKKVPIKKILELGRWRNGDTLKTYYMKPITNIFKIQTIKIIDFNEDELRISTHYSLYCAKICPRKVIKKGRSVTPLWIKDDGVEIHLLTLQNWVRKMLAMIGVDENPHSVRSAVISGEKEKKVPIEKILELGRWRNGNTLKTYYTKPISNM